jgi:hypothetical protein
MPINQQIWRWFGYGNARDALVGDGDYFLRDHTWGCHDTLLVLNQLFEWAATDDNRPVSAKAFVEALDFLTSANRTNDAFRLVLCYILVSEDRHESLPIDMEHVISSLAELARRHADALSKDAQQRALVLDVATRLPRLADILALHITSTSGGNVA